MGGGEDVVYQLPKTSKYGTDEYPEGVLRLYPLIRGHYYQVTYILVYFWVKYLYSKV